MEPKPIVEFSTHFRYTNDEQLRLLNISSSNNSPSVLFELNIRSTLVQILIGKCCYDCSVCLFIFLYILAELARAVLSTRVRIFGHLCIQ